jgi:hypothetical protein
MKLTTSQLLSGFLVAGAVGAGAYFALAPSAALSPAGSSVAPHRQAAAGPGARASRPALDPPAAPARASRPRAAPAAASPGVEVVFEVPWGSSPGHLGRELPQEASASGPMSFAVDRDGRAFVLDQVNARVAVFEKGKATRTVALPIDTYQDIAIDEHGGLALLDRLVSRAIAFVSPAGEIRHQIVLEGPGVPDGGSVTGLFARPDGTWVEVDHGQLVRVALADGSPDPDRPVAPGRFGVGGSFVRAALAGERTAEVARVSRDGGLTPLARTQLSGSVLQLNALEVDAKGRVYLGASLFSEEPEAPFESTPAGDEIVIFSPKGAEVARVMFPGNTGPEEQMRQLRIGDDGAIYHLGLSDQGATLRRYLP